MDSVEVAAPLQALLQTWVKRAKSPKMWLIQHCEKYWSRIRKRILIRFCSPSKQWLQTAPAWDPPGYSPLMIIPGAAGDQ